MINTSYSSPQLLSLFGRGDQAHVQATSPDQINKLADLTKHAGSNLSRPSVEAQKGVGADLPIVVPEGHVYESREQYEAKVAQARAHMEALEAGEQAFEKENGFRREVNSMLQGSYDAAISGRFGAISFGYHGEAQTFAGQMVSGVWGHLVEANRITKGLTSATFVEGTAKMEGIRPDQAKAKLEDHQKASQMNMLAQTMALNKSLEVSGGPLYAKQDGYAHMNNVEIRYEGKLVLTVEDHGGKVTLYDEDGTARDYGQMHQIAQNQPGAYARSFLG